MKTILHVIDSTEPGGAETVFAQLADELRKRGYRSLTVVSGPGWVTDELRRRGLQPIIIDAKGAFNWRLVRGLVRIIRAEKVDLIQSHLLGSNVYCALAGLIAHKPVIATFHGMVDVSPEERLRWLKFQIMNLGVSRFVAVSQRLCDAIHKEGLLNPRKTTVIYNGIEFERYGRSSRQELRELLGLPGDAVLIGSLGNLHPAKGYEYLIRAAGIVSRRHPSAHFVIGGDIKEHLIGDLRTLMADSGVCDRVHFIGFVKDSAAFLSQLDFFLLSSLSEGFSIATVEAMATGLPMVVTRCGGPEEIVSEGQDAVMVDAGSYESISAGLSALLDSPATAGQLARRAKESVEGRFSMHAMIDRYMDLYAQNI
ncbi:MAG TPA: glycosyltransferase [Steroidobacteraceae bacterium]|jgi:glycosyltransferase involved in cell wall biosynthesis